MRLFQTIGFSITVAFVACLLNGALCGLCSMLFYGGEGFFIIALLVICFSGLFALPGLVVFWLFLFIGVMKQQGGQLLFKPLVILTAVIALCTSACFCYVFHEELPMPIPILLLVAVGSAVASMFLQRPLFFSICPIVKKISHV